MKNDNLPAPLNWWRLLPLDASLAGAAIAVAIALCLSRVPAILDKARLNEALVFQSTSRVDAAERYATTGTLDATSNAAVPPPASADSPQANASGRFSY
jgi:hypothetical protein